MRKLLLLLVCSIISCSGDCPEECIIPALCSESGAPECSYDSETDCCNIYPTYASCYNVYTCNINEGE